MKIIKKGQRWSKEAKCTGRGNGGGGCGAVLRLSENDIYETCLNYYDDCITFCCPECGVETNIGVGVNVIPKGKRPTEEERKKIALKKKIEKQEGK